MRTTKIPRSGSRGPGDSNAEYFETVDMYLYLCKVYIKLDQPLKALEYYEKVSQTDKAWTCPAVKICLILLKRV